MIYECKKCKKVYVQDDMVCSYCKGLKIENKTQNKERINKEKKEKRMALFKK